MKVIVGEVYNKLISIGLFPMILLVILGEQIFTFAFGEEWGGISGTYVRILVPGYFLSFCLRLLQPSITYLKNRKSGSFSACLSLSQEWWRWLSEEGMGVLSLLLPCIVLRELCSGYGTMHTSWGLAGISKKESLEVLIKYAIIGFAVSIPLILVELISSSFYVIIITAVITTVMYYAITLHEDPMFKKMFSSFLIKVKNRS